MAAFTTMALVGAAALGSVAQASATRRAAKKQENAIRQQEEAAKVAAANEASLTPVDEDDPDFVIGRGRKSKSATPGGNRGSGSRQSGSVSARLGGLRPSSGVGL